MLPQSLQNTSKDRAYGISILNDTNKMPQYNEKYNMNTINLLTEFDDYSNEPFNFSLGRNADTDRMPSAFLKHYGPKSQLTRRAIK